MRYSYSCYTKKNAVQPASKDFITYLYRYEGSCYSFEVPESVDVLIHLGAWTPKSGGEANDIERSFSNIQFTKSLLNQINTLKKMILL